MDTGIGWWVLAHRLNRPGLFRRPWSVCWSPLSTVDAVAPVSARPISSWPGKPASRGNPGPRRAGPRTFIMPDSLPAGDSRSTGAGRVGRCLQLTTAPSPGAIGGRTKGNMAKNLRWKLLTIVCRARPVGLGLHAAPGKSAARPRSEGRRAPGDAGADRRCAAGRDRGGGRPAARGAAHAEHRRSAASPSPARSEFRVAGVPSAQDAAVPPGAGRRRPRLYDRSQSGGRLHLPPEAGRRQPAARGDGRTRRCRPSSAASTSSASPSRSSRATAATIRSWCSCPASPTSSAPRRSSGRRRCSS